MAACLKLEILVSRGRAWFLTCFIVSCSFRGQPLQGGEMLMFIFLVDKHIVWRVGGGKGAVGWGGG